VSPGPFPRSMHGHGWANFFFGPTSDLDSEHRPFSACATGGWELWIWDIDWGAQGSLHQDQTEWKKACFSRGPGHRGSEDAWR